MVATGGENFSEEVFVAFDELLHLELLLWRDATRRNGVMRASSGYRKGWWGCLADWFWLRITLNR